MIEKYGRVPAPKIPSSAILPTKSETDGKRSMAESKQLRQPTSRANNDVIILGEPKKPKIRTARS